LKQINIEIDTQALKKLFEKFDEDNNGTIDFDEFTEMIKHINYKEELDELFETYSVRNPDSDQNPDNNKVLTIPECIRFIQEV